MDPADLECQLIELAEEAGLEVRSLRGSPFDGSEAASSGVCRVREAVWVLLGPADSIEEHICVLVSALRTHAADFLENRYLPPAIRERIWGDPAPP